MLPAAAPSIPCALRTSPTALPPSMKSCAANICWSTRPQASRPTAASAPSTCRPATPLLPRLRAHTGCFASRPRSSPERFLPQTCNSGLELRPPRRSLSAMDSRLRPHVRPVVAFLACAGLFTSSRLAAQAAPNPGPEPAQRASRHPRAASPSPTSPPPTLAPASRPLRDADRAGRPRPGRPSSGSRDNRASPSELRHLSLQGSGLLHAGDHGLDRRHLAPRRRLEASCQWQPGTRQ